MSNLDKLYNTIYADTDIFVEETKTKLPIAILEDE